MESAILAGVPTTFTFLLELYKERKGWFDKKITGMDIKQTIKYDNVKKIFYVSSTGIQQPASFQDFESAKKTMSELNGAVVAPVNDLQKGEKYYVQIKVKLDKVHLPMNMEYVLFFISLWDFETDWYRQKIVY
jgi:dTDP-4-dehydrorhamnose 3,5-epimerase-like enzyme